MPQIKVNLIGAGRVGQTLLRLLGQLPECVVQDIYSGTPASAANAVRFACAGRAVNRLTDMQAADLWLLTVPDTQIANVASEISQAFGTTPRMPSTAIHCSGFFTAEQMAPLRCLDWKLASVHPVLTFADPAIAVEQFAGSFCGIEGDELAMDLIKPLLEKAGSRPFEIRSEAKSLYHAAAVISNNFTVVLQAIAREAWDHAGVPEGIARSLNANLLKATYENVTELGPQNALTGPAARGDEFVVSTQGRDVANWHPAAGELYKSFSTLAQSLKTHGVTNRKA